jgi:hypothetical protein
MRQRPLSEDVHQRFVKESQCFPRQHVGQPSTDIRLRFCGVQEASRAMQRECLVVVQEDLFQVDYFWLSCLR